MAGLKSLPKGLTPLLRFELSFIPEPNSGCWLWLGSPRGSMGYGAFQMEGKTHQAHRASWLLFRGEIPAGRWILHRCDNPSCVNPSHLFVGTHADNEADKVAKGRQSRGEAHSVAKQNPARWSDNGNSKLTIQDVRAIRAITLPQRKIAEIYGVTQALVSKIQRGEIWNDPVR